MFKDALTRAEGALQGVYLFGIVHSDCWIPLLPRTVFSAIPYGGIRTLHTDLSTSYQTVFHRCPFFALQDCVINLMRTLEPVEPEASDGDQGVCRASRALDRRRARGEDGSGTVSRNSMAERGKLGWTGDGVDWGRRGISVDPTR